VWANIQVESGIYDTTYFSYEIDNDSTKEWNYSCGWPFLTYANVELLVVTEDLFVRCSGFGCGDASTSFWSANDDIIMLFRAPDLSALQCVLKNSLDTLNNKIWFSNSLETLNGFGGEVFSFSRYE
tara:strand:- start:407 stop:784 length:378 start_codon:yes stop_codon:yes gene_type:complete